MTYGPMETHKLYSMVIGQAEQCFSLGIIGTLSTLMDHKIIFMRQVDR